MTRSEAIELGLIRYNTGAPCKRGHRADRYVSTGGCTLCLNPTRLNYKRHRIQLYRPELKVPGQHLSPENYTALVAELQAHVDAFVAMLPDHGPPVPPPAPVK